MTRQNGDKWSRQGRPRPEFVSGGELWGIEKSSLGLVTANWTNNQRQVSISPPILSSYLRKQKLRSECKSYFASGSFPINWRQPFTLPGHLKIHDNLITQILTISLTSSLTPTSLRRNSLVSDPPLVCLSLCPDWSLGEDRGPVSGEVSSSTVSGVFSMLSSIISTVMTSSSSASLASLSSKAMLSLCSDSW